MDAHSVLRREKVKKEDDYFLILSRILHTSIEDILVVDGDIALWIFIDIIIKECYGRCS